MLICLIYKEGILTGRALIKSPGEYKIGQNHIADLHLDYPTVSKFHALLIYNNEEIYLTDLGSRNGTLLLQSEHSQRLCEPHSKIKLTLNDCVTIGPFEVKFLATRSTDMLVAQNELTTTLHQYINQRALQNQYVHTSAESLYPLGLTLAGPLPLTEHHIKEACIQVFNERHEHGPLGAYLNNPLCREILVNGPDSIFVDLGQGLQQLTQNFSDVNALTAWARRLASLAGVRLDPNAPLAEGTLQNGARLQLALTPIASTGACIAIRRFPMRCPDESAALESGWLDPKSLTTIKSLVKDKKNILVSGGTAAGKTTLLNFIATYIDPLDRLVTIEDIFELQLNHPNSARLQCRATNTEGVGEITTRQLVRSALRMRPDRIILGECRGKEAFDLIQAMNTGHPGSMATIHANNARAALSRLSMLTLMADAGLGAGLAQNLCTEAIDAVIHATRDAKGQRKICEIILKNNESTPTYETVYTSH